MKKFAILALALIGLYLIYDGHFVARTDYEAGFSYGMTAFLAYAAGRIYFGQPVFKTNGGTVLAVAAVVLYLGYGDQGYELWGFGVIIGCMGLAILGMDVKEKELRERARLLGIEELMFPIKKQ
jgi:threonine/homoserine efflux transporter RhtA